MENSKRFLDAFVAIDMYLKDRDAELNTSFTQRVYHVSKKDKLIAHFAQDLNEFAQLRNAITHSRTDGNEVIAEPHIEIVEEIEGIVKALMQEKKLLSIFDKPVFKVDIEDDLKIVLKAKREKHYSVVPVYRSGTYVGVLHDALFTRCFEANLGEISNQTLSDMLKYQDVKDRVVFMAHDAQLIDAIISFNEHQNKGTRLIAIVITKDAHPNQEPLLILTLADLPKIVSNLNN